MVLAAADLESPLDSEKIKPVNPKRNQPWLSIGRTDAEAPVLWPPDVKRWLIGKDPDAGKDWGQEEKEKTEDETVGPHHWLDMSLSKLQETVKDGEVWRAESMTSQRAGAGLATERQQPPGAA